MPNPLLPIVLALASIPGSTELSHESIPPDAAPRARYMACAAALARLESAEYRVLDAAGAPIARVWRAFARRTGDASSDRAKDADRAPASEGTRIETTDGKTFVSNGSRAMWIDEVAKTYREIELAKAGPTAAPLDPSLLLARDWWLLELRARGLDPAIAPPEHDETFREIPLEAASGADADPSTKPTEVRMRIGRTAHETAIATVGGVRYESPLELDESIVIARGDDLPRHFVRRAASGTAPNRLDRAVRDEFRVEWIATDREMAPERFAVPTPAELESRGFTRSTPPARQAPASKSTMPSR